jgi:hypothetical protein
MLRRSLHSGQPRQGPRIAGPASFASPVGYAEPAFRYLKPNDREAAADHRDIPPPSNIALLLVARKQQSFAGPHFLRAAILAPSH